MASKKPPAKTAHGWRTHRIYLFIITRFELTPVAFAEVPSMHCVLYAWLYQTPWYIVMAALVSVTSVISMATATQEPQRVDPARVYWLTGSMLLLTAGFFLGLHVFVTAGTA